MCNPERPSKRRLLPLVLAFRDEAHTRPDKHPCGRDFFNRPAVAPHVHSIMVIHPALRRRFLEIAGDLETSGIFPQGTAAFRVQDNRSLRFELEFAHRVWAVMTADPAGCRARVRAEVRGWIDYSAKLMRRRSGADDGDLYTALPTETGSPLPGDRLSPRGIARGLDWRPASEPPAHTLTTLVIQARRIVSIRRAFCLPKASLRTVTGHQLRIRAASVMRQ